MGSEKKGCLHVHARQQWHLLAVSAKACPIALDAQVVMSPREVQSGWVKDGGCFKLPGDLLPGT